MPSTITMGLRCTAPEIEVVRPRLGTSTERDCGVSMSSFTAGSYPEGSRRGRSPEREATKVGKLRATLRVCTL